MEIISGIYKITNKINKKIYIGQSIDIHRRWREHKSASRPINLGGDNCPIHMAIRKYGINNFDFEIIEKIDYSKLNEREIYWINYYNSYNEGYNATIGGDNGRQYNYIQIIDLWKAGYNCKDIEYQLHCGDQVITKALRLYDISEEEARSRSNFNVSKAVVAIDIITNEPLKVFPNERTAFCATSFESSFKKNNNISNAIKKHSRANGYYWAYLTNNNSPTRQLTIKEFLCYQQPLLYHRSVKVRQQISIMNRKVERCSRDELKKLIREKSFIEIGNMYHVSDNAVRKWCDYYNLPRRKKDIKEYTDEEWQQI